MKTTINVIQVTYFYFRGVLYILQSYNWMTVTFFSVMSLQSLNTVVLVVPDRYAMAKLEHCVFYSLL